MCSIAISSPREALIRVGSRTTRVAGVIIGVHPEMEKPARGRINACNNIPEVRPVARAVGLGWELLRSAAAPDVERGGQTPRAPINAFTISILRPARGSQPARPATARRQNLASPSPTERPGSGGMSAIFGLANLDGRPVSDESLPAMASALAHWGPDGGGMWREGPCALGQRLLHNTPESLFERMPLRGRGGSVALVAAARLDN